MALRFGDGFTPLAHGQFMAVLAMAIVATDKQRAGAGDLLLRELSNFAEQPSPLSPDEQKVVREIVQGLIREVRQHPE